MSSKNVLLTMLTVVVGFSLVADSANAALTAEQRVQLAKIGKDLGALSKDLRRKKIDGAAADKLVNEIEAKVKKIATDAKLKRNDRNIVSKLRVIAGLRKRIALVKKAMASKIKTKKSPDGDSKGTISFAKDVAPILASRCGTCHGTTRQSGGLRLDTFARLRSGGGSGALITPGNATASLLMRRLRATGNRRMPKSGQPLSGAQLVTIANWIEEGAKFDGGSETASLASLKAGTPGEPAKPKPKTPVIVYKAKGDEKVSFVKHIAPTLVNLCLRCHSGNNPRGGLSMVTFENLMRGGDSGRVLLPGNMEGSRLFRLIGALEQPRMPQGQGRITKTWYEDLKVWIKEGIKYDGGDPKISLRQLVPTDEETRAMELAKLTDEEFSDLRLKRSEELWKRVAPRERPRYVSSKEFFVYGNGTEERMKEIDAWAEEFAKELRSMFGIKGSTIWRGRLTIFVFRDRFGYSEFNQVVHSRQVPKSVSGHSIVQASMEDAYIVLQDVGDETETDSPSLQLNLIDHLTGAFLKRAGRDLPDWVTRGTGLAMAAGKVGAKDYFSEQRELALDALQEITKPEDIFTKGKFSPGEIGPVGYTLVTYMLKSGGAKKYGMFISTLQDGTNLQASIKKVYPPADMRALAVGYFANIKKR